MIDILVLTNESHKDTIVNDEKNWFKNHILSILNMALHLNLGLNLLIPANQILYPFA